MTGSRDESMTATTTTTADGADTAATTAATATSTINTPFQRQSLSTLLPRISPSQILDLSSLHPLRPTSTSTSSSSRSNWPWAWEWARPWDRRPVQPFARHSRSRSSRRQQLWKRPPLIRLDTGASVWNSGFERQCLSRPDAAARGIKRRRCADEREEVERGWGGGLRSQQYQQYQQQQQQQVLQLGGLAKFSETKWEAKPDDDEEEKDETSVPRKKYIITPVEEYAPLRRLDAPTPDCSEAELPPITLARVRHTSNLLANAKKPPWLRQKASCHVRVKSQETRLSAAPSNAPSDRPASASASASSMDLGSETIKPSIENEMGVVRSSFCFDDSATAYSSLSAAENSNYNNNRLETVREEDEDLDLEVDADAITIMQDTPTPAASFMTDTEETRSNVAEAMETEEEIEEESMRSATPSSVIITRGDTVVDDDDMATVVDENEDRGITADADIEADEDVDLNDYERMPTPSHAPTQNEHEGQAVTLPFDAERILNSAARSDTLSQAPMSISRTFEELKTPIRLPLPPPPPPPALETPAILGNIEEGLTTALASDGDTTLNINYETPCPIARRPSERQHQPRPLVPSEAQAQARKVDEAPRDGGIVKEEAAVPKEEYAEEEKSTQEDDEDQAQTEEVTQQAELAPEEPESSSGIEISQQDTVASDTDGDADEAVDNKGDDKGENQDEDDDDEARTLISEHPSSSAKTVIVNNTLQRQPTAEPEIPTTKDTNPPFKDNNYASDDNSDAAPSSQVKSDIRDETARQARGAEAATRVPPSSPPPERLFDDTSSTSASSPSPSPSSSSSSNSMKAYFASREPTPEIPYHRQATASREPPPERFVSVLKSDDDYEGYPRDISLDHQQHHHHSQVPAKYIKPMHSDDGDGEGVSVRDSSSSRVSDGDWEVVEKKEEKEREWDEEERPRSRSRSHGASSRSNSSSSHDDDNDDNDEIHDVHVYDGDDSDYYDDGLDGIEVQVSNYSFRDRPQGFETDAHADADHSDDNSAEIHERSSTPQTGGDPGPDSGPRHGHQQQHVREGAWESEEGMDLKQNEHVISAAEQASFPDWTRESSQAAENDDGDEFQPPSSPPIYPGQLSGAVNFSDEEDKVMHTHTGMQHGDDAAGEDDRDDELRLFEGHENDDEGTPEANDDVPSDVDELFDERHIAPDLADSPSPQVAHSPQQYHAYSEDERRDADNYDYDDDHDDDHEYETKDDNDHDNYNPNDINDNNTDKLSVISSPEPVRISQEADSILAAEEEKEDSFVENNKPTISALDPRNNNNNPLRRRRTTSMSMAASSTSASASALKRSSVSEIDLDRPAPQRKRRSLLSPEDLIMNRPRSKLRLSFPPAAAAAADEAVGDDDDENAVEDEDDDNDNVNGGGVAVDYNDNHENNEYDYDEVHFQLQDDTELNPSPNPNPNPAEDGKLRTRGLSLSGASMTDDTMRPGSPAADAGADAAAATAAAVKAKTAAAAGAGVSAVTANAALTPAAAAQVSPPDDLQDDFAAATGPDTLLEENSHNSTSELRHPESSQRLALSPDDERILADFVMQAKAKRARYLASAGEIKGEEEDEVDEEESYEEETGVDDNNDDDDDDDSNAVSAASLLTNDDSTDTTPPHTQFRPLKPESSSSSSSHSRPRKSLTGGSEFTVYLPADKTPTRSPLSAQTRRNTRRNREGAVRPRQMLEQIQQRGTEEEAAEAHERYRATSWHRIDDAPRQPLPNLDYRRWRRPGQRRRKSRGRSRGSNKKFVRWAEGRVEAIRRWERELL